MGKELSRVLDVRNSPLLFGCRTGICATCICRIEGIQSQASDDEKEVLEVFAPGVEGARLACQVRVEGDMEIRALLDQEWL